MKGLWRIFRDTLAYFAFDPLGMLTAVGLRILEGEEAAVLKVDEIGRRKRGEL